jgi:restriction endonuclease S subunit
MESTVVQIGDLIEKDVWSYEHYSHKSQLVRQTLENCPYDLVQLRDIVILLGRGFSNLGGSESGDVRVLSARDITNTGKISSKSDRYISFEKHNRLEKTKVIQDDVVLAKYFAGQVSNVAAIYTCEESATLDNSVIRLRLDRSKVEPRYLVRLMNSSLGRFLLSSAAIGSVQPTINMSSLFRVKIPLPSLLQQKKLIKDLEDKYREAAKLEKRAHRLRVEARQFIDRFLGFEGEENAS